MDLKALAQAFNQMPHVERTPSGLPNHWHFSVRHVPLNPPGDLLQIIHPQSRFMHCAGPEDILSLDVTAQANVVVHLLLDSFVTGVDRGPNGEILNDKPKFVPSRWSTNSDDLARAVEVKLKALGIRQELCTVHSATTEENAVAAAVWSDFLKNLTGKAAVCGGCKQPPSSFSKPMQRCGRCKTAFYCSKKCQKSDWKKHKNNCGEPTEKKHDPFYYLNNIAHTVQEASVLAKSINLDLPDGRGNSQGIS